MSGGFPLGLDICGGTQIGFVGANFGGGTKITPSATANTKGSYVQLISSTAADTVWIVVECISESTITSALAIDLAIGGAGSEQIIASNLAQSCGGTGGRNLVGRFSFPCAIPAGTRLSARSQSNATSADDVECRLTLYDGAFTQMEGCGGCDSIGFTTATTLGTSITAGSTGTKGSYAQLTASTSRDYIGLMGAMDMGLAAGGFNYLSLDVAIGAAASEQIIIPNQGMCMGSNGIGTVIGFLPIAIPAGTRLSARATLSTAGITACGLTLYGVYQ